MFFVQISSVERESLTHISIAITLILNALPKDQEKLLILDTMTTLMLYNNPSVVSEFMHSLSGQIRFKNIKSVVLTLEDATDKKVISAISEFVDTVIKVK